MANYKHGEMDATAQENTFNGFIKWITRVGIVVILTLIFFALVNS